MKTFIQLKNNVGYATLIVKDGEPDHSITPEDTTAIQVFSDDPDQFLKKLYSPDTNSWSDAPIYDYAEVNLKGEIIEIKRTVFQHEITGPILNDQVLPTSKWVNGEWVHADPLSPAEITVFPVITEEPDSEPTV